MSWSFLMSQKVKKVQIAKLLLLHTCVSKYMHQKQFSCYAGRQEVSRCRTRGEYKKWWSIRVKDPNCLWNLGQTSSEVQNRCISVPTKSTDVLRKTILKIQELLWWPTSYDELKNSQIRHRVQWVSVNSLAPIISCILSDSGPLKLVAVFSHTQSNFLKYVENHHGLHWMTFDPFMTCFSIEYYRSKHYNDPLRNAESVTDAAQEMNWKYKDCMSNS